MRMSDEEEERNEEEEEEEAEAEAEAEEAAPEHHEEEEVEHHEEKLKHKPRPAADPEVKEISEAERAMLASKKKHDEEEALKLLDYEERRKLEKEKEDEELRILKEKQERRKAEREEEEELMAERKRVEDERRRTEEEERKKKAEAKKAGKEAEKKKRLALMAGQFAAGEGPNFKLPEKHEGDMLTGAKPKKAEATLSKEQLDEIKKRTLADLCKPLQTEGVDLAELRKMVKEFHQRIAKLEADRYDLEKRQSSQEYDFKELMERQKQQARAAAVKKGLDPDAASSKHPAKLSVASKFDRQIDRRSYGERRHLYEKSKARKPPAVFHGSARPPSEWGVRKDLDELEQLRKKLDAPRYVEVVKVEGARPPMEPVPVQPLPAEEPEPAE